MAEDTLVVLSTFGDALPADFKHALEYAAASIWALGTTEFFYRNVIGMQRLTTEFKTKVEVVRLPGRAPCHSPLVAPVASHLVTALACLDWSEPRIPVVPNADGRPTRLFDLFRGPHWTLLAFGEAPGISVHTVVRPGEPTEGLAVVDVDGHARAGYGATDGTLVLVRPDGYVGLVATTAP